MQFKGLFVGETCTGTGAVQTLAGAYELETGVNTIPFADAYADGAIVPFVLLASNGVNRLEGQAVFDDAGTLTLSPWVIWNGTTYETYDGSGFTLPAGTHRIWVGIGGNNVSGVNPHRVGHPSGAINVPDNIVKTDGYQDFDSGRISGALGAVPLAQAFYASPILFNRVEIKIGTAGAAESTVEAGLYRYRERTLYDEDCGLPGPLLVKAVFDGAVTGNQRISVPLQILPPGRYYSATWSIDTSVTLLRCQWRTHAGAPGIFTFNNQSPATWWIDNQSGLAPDLSAENTPVLTAAFRSHIVGLAYVPD